MYSFVSESQNFDLQTLKNLFKTYIKAVGILSIDNFDKAAKMYHTFEYNEKEWEATASLFDEDVKRTGVLVCLPNDRYVHNERTKEQIPNLIVYILQILRKDNVNWRLERDESYDFSIILKFYNDDKGFIYKIRFEGGHRIHEIKHNLSEQFHNYLYSVPDEDDSYEPDLDW
jgi:hypothetical protein